MFTVAGMMVLQLCLFYVCHAPDLESEFDSEILFLKSVAGG